MIPKIIHYIWVGGKPLPKIAKKCIKSWKKYCPDYEIKRWDESNLDLEFCDYIKEAYELKKYAFVSDVLRTKVLFENGGIYLDIDVELYKPLYKFMKHKCFYGFENNESIAPGLIMGTEKGNVDLKNILNYYQNHHFVINGNMQLKTICSIYSEYYESKGLNLNNTTQEIDGTMFYSSEYFCPKNYQTGKIKKTKNTVAIHHYLASWLTTKMKIKNKVIQIVKRILGEKRVAKIKEKRSLRGKQ